MKPMIPCRLSVLVMNGRGGGETMAEAIDLCVAIVQEVIPFAVAFGITRVIVRIFLGGAFKGRIDL